jgi:hypothetical protein
MPPSTQVISGARLAFFINTKVVAYANDVSGGEDTMHEPVETLDHLEVIEHVPVAYRVNLSSAIFRTVAYGPSTAEAPGSLKELGIYPKFEQILFNQGVPAMLVDGKVTGKTVEMFEKVKPSTRRFTIPAKGIVRQNVDFVTTRLRDESEVQPVRSP